MDINESTSRRIDARTQVVELGVASVETHGNPMKEGEFLGHDIPLGIAGEETRGVTGVPDEFLGRSGGNGIANG